MPDGRARPRDGGRRRRLLADGAPRRPSARPGRRAARRGVARHLAGLRRPRRAAAACAATAAASASSTRCRAGLRPALYVKDDDYRLSFLHGNFTTLTQPRRRRPGAHRGAAPVAALRLAARLGRRGPRAPDGAGRGRLARRPRAAGRRRPRAAPAGGALPGLERRRACCAETVERAAALPAVADLGIVPVSLAAEGDLRRVTRGGRGGRARRGRELAARYRARARRGLRARRRRVPPAVRARCRRRATPPSSTRTASACRPLLLEEAARSRRAADGGGRRRRAGGRPVPAPCASYRHAGRAGGRRAPAKPAARASACPCAPFPVVNRLFGPHVTVTGLLGGREVLDGAAPRPARRRRVAASPRASSCRRSWGAPWTTSARTSWRPPAAAAWSSPRRSARRLLHCPDELSLPPSSSSAPPTPASPRSSTASSGSRQAVVHETPGVTRDRKEVEVEWEGRLLHDGRHRRLRHRRGLALRRAHPRAGRAGHRRGRRRALRRRRPRRPAGRRLRDRRGAAPRRVAGGARRQQDRRPGAP